MGIDVPNLDDRDYEAYLEQAKKLIPAYSEEWTDFNPHDPGITILEVLAWVTETHTYQLDQITDAHREKYLQLMGYHRRLQEPATAPVVLSPPSSAAGERLPAGSRLLVTDGTDERYRFETDHDLVLTDASLARLVTADRNGVTDNSQENNTDGMFYRPFGNPVERGDELYLGFDGDPFAAGRSLTLVANYHDENLPAPTPADPGDPDFEPTVSLQWAYRPPGADGWRPLTVAEDRTTTLYEGGAIELFAPDDAPRMDDGAPFDVTDSAHVWIRCRVERAGYEIPPQLDAIEPNTVAASHRVHVGDETLSQVSGLGEPTALNGQTYELEHTPVFSAEIRVDGAPFVEVADFDASGPTDPHYRLDRETGRVTFGDGEQGRVPPADATVTADYVYGGGEDGCVSPDAVWQFESPGTTLDGGTLLGDLDVAAAGAATGGRDRETITGAVERLRRDLRSPDRGVTITDYETLAARTPGVRVGQTNVVVDGETVTVVVVPYAPPDVPRPTPSEGFLGTVEQYVTERATLGDRVTVTGPTYVGLDVTVSGQAHPRYTDDGYEADVRATLDSLVHPLVAGGWPFGRSLSTADIAERVADLDGIDYVSDVDITAHGGTTRDDTIAIGPRELFAVVDVTTELSMAAGDGGR
ncbi:putative baseplate assembly protein [Haloarcula sp. S1CR25-12]|uniref:Baseplate assembly protein n=1 Tax=Haloarcula saliterrae TaxID=2950534 RepID=A0ABU2FE44_9EURY|nr:putative baseplate assembly protein [Haloarcula sp. S1CR25-12]MDS0260497.1 putative baseplate assembly protein [Haloarcula sp. S1CR25-12]